LLLLGLFSVSILANVLRAGKITADKIYGAICVYLLVGYAWAFAYAIIEELQPGSFSGPVTTDPVDYITRVTQMRYFSFITLTTVGYGDIVPQSPVARTFATLEAVIGQIYLAVLVARLVGLHIVHANSTQSSQEK
jgi:voltage-gated potassium channel Kch